MRSEEALRVVVRVFAKVREAVRVGVGEGGRLGLGLRGRRGVVVWEGEPKTVTNTVAE